MVEDFPLPNLERGLKMQKQDKLILKVDSLKYKKRFATIFGCQKFEPNLCCLCHEVNGFINKLSQKSHDPGFCQSD